MIESMSLAERVENLERRVVELESLIAQRDVRNSIAETLRTIADELEDDDELVPAKKADPRDENLDE